MPLEAAVAGMATAEHLFAQTLAACTQWIEDTESQDADEALTHIYYDTLPPPDNKNVRTAAEWVAVRPFAIVSTRPFSGGYAWNRIAAEAWEDSGQMEVQFEYNVLEEMLEDNQAIMRWFKNKVGNILRPSSGTGMTDLAHSPGYLAINSIGLFGTPADPAVGRVNEKMIKTYGDFVSARFLVSWGVAG